MGAALRGLESNQNARVMNPGRCLAPRCWGAAAGWDGPGRVVLPLCAWVAPAAGTRKRVFRRVPGRCGVSRLAGMGCVQLTRAPRYVGA